MVCDRGFLRHHMADEDALNEFVGSTMYSLQLRSTSGVKSHCTLRWRGRYSACTGPEKTFDAEEALHTGLWPSRARTPGTASRWGYRMRLLGNSTWHRLSRYQNPRRCQFPGARSQTASWLEQRKTETSSQSERQADWYVKISSYQWCSLEAHGLLAPMSSSW